MSRTFLAIVFLLIPVSLLEAQFGGGGFGGANTDPATAAKSQKQRWKVGVEVQANNAPCAGIFATVAIPSEWPEQSVKIVQRQVTGHVRKLRFRKSRDGVEQMVIEIPRLALGDKAIAVITFEIEKRISEPPKDTAAMVVPKKLPRSLLKTLGSSPFIETRDGAIRAKARELVAGKKSGWEKAKAIYDFVRDSIRFQEGKLQGARVTLKTGAGQKEDIANLFIALCRSAKIPARTVWVPDHSYAEFYLHGADGKGKWYPCEMAGKRSFGSMVDYRPILQRGDNFKVPERKKPVRYVGEFLKVKSVRGSGRPSVKFVRELLPAL